VSTCMHTYIHTHYTEHHAISSCSTVYYDTCIRSVQMLVSVVSVSMATDVFVLCVFILLLTELLFTK
jgi:multisubunit Na+/H+ antiporter MnhG subunit